jgi:hypothetical protein
MTGEQVRWGPENLNLSTDRLKQLGFPVKMSCEDREGVRTGRIQTWDGKDWKISSDWYTSDDSVIAPMGKEAEAKYAAEKKIVTGCLLTNRWRGSHLPRPSITFLSRQRRSGHRPPNSNACSRHRRAHVLLAGSRPGGISEAVIGVAIEGGARRSNANPRLHRDADARMAMCVNLGG